MTGKPRGGGAPPTAAPTTVALWTVAPPTAAPSTAAPSNAARFHATPAAAVTSAKAKAKSSAPVKASGVAKVRCCSSYEMANFFCPFQLLTKLYDISWYFDYSVFSPFFPSESGV